MGGVYLLTRRTSFIQSGITISALEDRFGKRRSRLRALLGHCRLTKWGTTLLAAKKPMQIGVKPYRAANLTEFQCSPNQAVVS